ncbi:M23 family peptidase [Blastococcus sp. TBT05-19]|uniref:M23 family metallopeptidase n=1 Tax=Blastococcus sp. TBT05-19 TaxID=2250581 RepID=UPI000DE85DB1|nr:M23 family metallopeptidase [Blastococcus sp. TBT05-19]RBY92013.1 M23 family peptidase [Blastococcus sp. TBT05-19]
MSQRRPTGPVSVRSGGRRSAAGRPARSLRVALLGVVAGAALIGSAVPAVAAPPPPPNPTDGQLGAARTTQEAAAAEVGRISGLLAAAEAELERYGIQAEAAGVAYEAALEAFQMAQAAADQAAAELQLAADAVAAAEARIATFSRDTYMKGSSLSSTAAILDAQGPGELIQKAAMLDYVADNQVDVLGALEVARVRQANADATARAARDERAAAEDTAQAAKQTADAQLAEQQAAYQQVDAQKAQFEQQLQAAQIQLLQLQGARDAYAQWEAQKAAEEAAAAAAAERAARAAAEAAAAARDADEGPSSSGGGGVGEVVAGHAKPTSGRVSSCYGWRWGALHGGVDIAARIGTPVYAASSGVVRRAGSATGFGLAVYIEGDDGEVTVYGHVNRYFVRAGERVSAGEQIAEVGNRGQSTGPHLHFEVHPNGAMHGGQVDPVPWLNARGIYLGGCGG